MTFPSSSELRERDLGDYGFARARDAAFDAVQGLWRMRKAAGMKQKDLAANIARDRGWVSSSLKGPGNWTMRTFGELVAGLGGEIEILVHPLEVPISPPLNYDAYDANSISPPPPGEIPVKPSPANPKIDSAALNAAMA